jgi:hypothetical protein
MRGTTPGFGTNAPRREYEKLSVFTMSGSGSQTQDHSFEKFGMWPNVAKRMEAKE